VAFEIVRLLEKLSQFLFMSVLAQTFLAFVRCHFMAFSFSTAGHFTSPTLM